MVKIIADTTSCIPPEEAEQLGIAYIPQIIVFGEKEYRDDTQMDSKTFLKMLKTSPSLPKTAAPPPALYDPIYRKSIDAGETMIVVCPSAGLSGTFRSATVAAQDFPKADIRIIDTNTIASGLGSIVLYAQSLVKQGLDADTVEAAVKEMAARERVYFLVDTLEYLYKGGRIGGAAALFGSLLQVKPILTLMGGKTESFESQRTKSRALARLMDIVVADYPTDKEGYLTIGHGDAEKEATNLANELCKRLNIADIRLFDQPPAILVHAGPGVLSVSFMQK